MIRYTKSDNQNAGKSGYTVFPEGTYDVEITDVKQTRSSSGKPQLEVTGAIVDGPYADKTMKLWLTLTSKAIWVFENFCDALNIQPIDTGDQDEHGKTVYARDEAELLGRVAKLSCTQREYNGKTYNDWECVGVSDFDGAQDAGEDEDEDEEAPQASSKPAKGNSGKRPRPRPRR